MIEMIKFGAEWCGPCRMMKPVISQIQEKYADDPEVKITNIDVDVNPELGTEYGVRSIPMIVFLKDNSVIQKKVGTVTANEIASIIEDLRGADVILDQN